MKAEIGRMKSGKLVRIIQEKGEYKLEIGGRISDSFRSRETAFRKGKILMLKSWLPEAKEESLEDMLNSYLDISYNFTLEWCDRQAEKQPDCECGCWGYPMELGTFWSWAKNKYRGCPHCGENIEHKKNLSSFRSKDE